MTKAELVDLVQQDVVIDGHDLSKKAIEHVLDYAFAEISDAIAAGRFSYPGFGTWLIRARKARNGVNPQTLLPIRIPAARKVGFTAAPSLKKKVRW